MNIDILAEIHNQIGMQLDIPLRLRHMRCFLEIARAQSVSRAAEHLNITQPAVSRSLRELEDMLGVSLFERVGRGLRLNEQGRVFQAHAVAAMTELTRGCERVGKAGLRQVRLSIGALPTAASELVPEAALAFHKENPHVRLHILTGPNWLLFNQLRDGLVDLVVGRMPEKEGAGVTFEQLYLEDVILVCRPDHPILSTRQPDRVLSEYPLIMPPRGAVISSAVDRYLTSIGLPEMRGTFETVALPVARKIIQASDALWFISKGVVSEDLKSEVLRDVGLSSPLLAGSIGISFSRSAAFNLERDLFAQTLRSVAS